MEMDYSQEERRHYVSVTVTDGNTSDPIYTPRVHQPYPLVISALPVANATVEFTIATRTEVEADTADWETLAELPAMINGVVTAIRGTAAGADVTLRALLAEV